MKSDQTKTNNLSSLRTTYTKYVEPFNNTIRTAANVYGVYTFMNLNYGKYVAAKAVAGETAQVVAATTATTSASSVVLTALGVGAVCGGMYFGYTKYKERQERLALEEQVKLSQERENMMMTRVLFASNDFLAN